MPYCGLPPQSDALHIYDALYSTVGKSRHILTSHEQGAAPWRTAMRELREK